MARTPTPGGPKARKVESTNPLPTPRPHRASPVTLSFVLVLLLHRRPAPRCIAAGPKRPAADLWRSIPYTAEQPGRLALLHCHLKHRRWRDDRKATFLQSNLESQIRINHTDSRRCCEAHSEDVCLLPAPSPPTSPSSALIIREHKV